MSGAIIEAVLAWLVLLLGVDLFLIVRRGRSLSARVLALDHLSLVFVPLLLVLAYARDSVFFLDAALVIALLSFLGTLRLARYVREEEEK